MYWSYWSQQIILIQQHSDTPITKKTRYLLSSMQKDIGQWWNVLKHFILEMNQQIQDHPQNSAPWYQFRSKNVYLTNNFSIESIAIAIARDNEPNNIIVLSDLLSLFTSLNPLIVKWLNRINLLCLLFGTKPYWYPYK